MAEEKKTETAAPDADNKADDAANEIVNVLDGITKRLDGIDTKNVELEKSLDEAKKAVHPNGVPNIRKGEDVMTSRPYSMMRLACALRKRADGNLDWRDHAKTELDLSQRLQKAYHNAMGYAANGELVPLGADLMPTEAREVIDGEKEYKVEGIAKSLVKECRDVMAPSLDGYDQGEFERIRKDLSANAALTGGTLVSMPGQGELIELLRGIEVMSRAGAQQIDLPPQGAIRLPRVTSGVTIAAYAEAATTSESTPGTGALLLQAKKYAGLVDIPEELMKFATSVAVEAWLRREFVRDIAVQTDKDMIYGAGGTSIQGAINYSGVRLVTASTTGATGDTLEAADPARLYADIADQDAPVDLGFFYALTNTLWAGLVNRRADAVSAADAAGAMLFNSGTSQVGGGQVRKTINGETVITSTHIPTDRSKGGVSTLTMLFGGVGREWLIARSGVVEFSMTNSDASKFAQGLSTLRGTVFMDAGPRHEESFGYIDDIVNS